MLTDARPPMTSSAVFGDITGVLKETKESSSDAADVINELHHKQFAVSWNRHDYELDPKACIEDIFHGGTGFKKVDDSTPPEARKTGGTGLSSVSTVPTEASLSMPYHSDFDTASPIPNARLLSEEEEREDLRSWTLKTVY